MNILPKFTDENKMFEHLDNVRDKNYFIFKPMGYIEIENSEDSFFYNINVKPYLITAKSKTKKSLIKKEVLMEISKSVRTFRDHARNCGTHEYKRVLTNSKNFKKVIDWDLHSEAMTNDVKDECAYYELPFINYTDMFAAEFNENENAENVEKKENVEKFIETPEPSPEKLDVKIDHSLSLENMISKVIRDSVKSEYTNDMITHVLHNKLNEYGIKPKVKNHILERYEGGEKIDLGDMIHKDFFKVLKYAECRLNIFLTGESGSGKTHCAYEVGKALGLEVFSKSVGIETGMHEFMGWLNVDGKPIETDFERAYKNGGIFLCDEIDGGNPNVLLALNQALGNSVCTFASGTQAKHKDFICIAGANTWGFGATPDYVGRNPIDGATLNRFVFVEYGYDEDLEVKLCGNEVWARKVQKIRANVKKNRVKHIVSPRASIMGAKLLKYGINEQTVLKDVVYQGLSLEEVNLIKAD